MGAKSASLKFTKMHALGNDFVVIDAVTQKVKMTSTRARKIADRHTGIGCDQILLIEPPGNPEVDFRYRIFNQDGSEVNQCGNGARCFAKYVYDRKLIAKTEILVETGAGIMELKVNPDRTYSVALGIPDFEFAAVPYIATATQVAGQPVQLSVEEDMLTFFTLSMGNPHAVVVVDSVDTAEVARIGELLQGHPSFPERVNVGFMQVLNPSEIRLRVYERGAGETLACGSGACAAVAAGIKNGLLESPVTVNLPLGILNIGWHGDGHATILTGPATTVFHGQTRI